MTVDANLNYNKYFPIKQREAQAVHDFNQIKDNIDANVRGIQNAALAYERSLPATRETTYRVLEHYIENLSFYSVQLQNCKEFL